VYVRISMIIGSSPVGRDKLKHLLAAWNGGRCARARVANPFSGVDPIRLVPRVSRLAVPNCHARVPPKTKQRGRSMTIRRRRFLRAGIAMGAASPSLLSWARAWTAEQPFAPEKGAALRLLRASTFLPAEGETFAANVAAFAAATGVPVTIDNVNQDDLVSKSALAVQIASGPDLIWTQNTTAHLFADKLIDVSDVAAYLGGKYGGWYPVCVDYGTGNGRWICIPVFVVGSLLNYRVSWLAEAGFDKPTPPTSSSCARR